MATREPILPRPIIAVFMDSLPSRSGSCGRNAEHSIAAQRKAVLSLDLQNAFSETKCFGGFYFQVGVLGSGYGTELRRKPVIERRPFHSLSGDRRDWLNAS